MPPSVVVLAGPNGAGKSTAAPFLLRDALAVTEFVNADRIAQGLSGLYQEITAEWHMYDTSQVGAPRLLASGRGTETTLVADPVLWNSIVGQWSRT